VFEGEGYSGEGVVRCREGGGQAGLGVDLLIVLHFTKIS